MKAIHDQFMDEVQPGIDRWITGARGVIREMEEWYGASPSIKYPDDVREAINGHPL